MTLNSRVINPLMKKRIRTNWPELYLIAATLYYWFLTSSLFNPIAIGLLSVLLFYMLTKNITLGLILSTVYILLNLYLVLALISELSEFQSLDSNFMKLIIIGPIFLGLNLLAGYFMLRSIIRRMHSVPEMPKSHIRNKTRQEN